MYLVRSLAFLRVPLSLVDCDGNRPVPVGGILLLRLPGTEPTTFADVEECEEAIRRTLQHGQRWGYPETFGGWTRESYEIQSCEDYDAERRRPKFPKRRALEKPTTEAA